MSRRRAAIIPEKTSEYELRGRSHSRSPGINSVDAMLRAARSRIAGGLRQAESAVCAHASPPGPPSPASPLRAASSPCAGPAAAVAPPSPIQAGSIPRSPAAHWDCSFPVPAAALAPPAPPSCGAHGVALRVLCSPSAPPSRLLYGRRALPMPGQGTGLVAHCGGSLASPASSRLFSAVFSTSSSSSTSSASRSTSLASLYLSFLESHPVITKALTAGAIFTTADITSQGLTYLVEPSGTPSSEASSADKLAGGAEGQGFHWDAHRTARMAAAGLIMSGPTLHVWYSLMARWRPGRDVSSIVHKILAGTFLYGPVFNTVFFSANAALQGEGSREIVGRLKRDLVPTFLRGLVYWPFCDFLTYRFVPVQLQSRRLAGPTLRGAQHGSWSPSNVQAGIWDRDVLHSAQHFEPRSILQGIRTAHRGIANSFGFGVAPAAARSFSSSSQSQIYLNTSSASSRAVGQGSVSLWGLAPRGQIGPMSRFAVPGSLPSSAQPARSYVQLCTELQVADNSGAKRVMCIKVLKGAKPNAAKIGDIIIASVKSADFHGKVKKGEVVTCVVVRAAMPRRRTDGSMIRFDGPAAVIINKNGEPIGTRVFGPVPHELRRKKLVKVLALAQHVA